MTHAQSQALKAVARFGALTIDQAADVLMVHRQYASKLLRQLAGKGAVSFGIAAKEIPTGVARPIQTFHVYGLTPAGLRWCLDELGIRDEDIPAVTNWQGKALVGPSTYHDIGVIDCVISFWRSAVLRGHSHEVVKILPDFVRRAKDGRPYHTTADKVDDEKQIAPDARLTLRSLAGDDAIDLHLEFDRGKTMLKKAKKRHGSIEEKLEQYSAYFRRDDRAHKIGARDALLYVTLHRARIDRICADDVLPWDKFANLRGRTLFATLDEIKPDFLTAPWSMVTGQRATLVKVS